MSVKGMRWDEVKVTAQRNQLQLQVSLDRLIGRREC